MIHGDSHLRNFIVTNNYDIVGLDFEETHLGDVSEDIAQLCASILTTNPQYTKEKIILTHEFIKTYEQLTKQKITDIDIKIERAVNSTLAKRKMKNKWIKRN